MDCEELAERILTAPPWSEETAEALNEHVLSRQERCPSHNRREQGRAVKAAIEVMDADASRLVHRNAFNVTGMNFTPEEVAAAIRVHIPSFTIDYKIDPVRQAIADSWPDSLDDTAAREEWDWQPLYTLAEMTEDMLSNLERKLSLEE